MIWYPMTKHRERSRVSGQERCQVGLRRPKGAIQKPTQHPGTFTTQMNEEAADGRLSGHLFSVFVSRLGQAIAKH